MLISYCWLTVDGGRITILCRWGTRRMVIFFCQLPNQPPPLLAGTLIVKPIELSSSSASSIFPSPLVYFERKIIYCRIYCLEWRGRRRLHRRTHVAISIFFENWCPAVFYPYFSQCQKPQRSRPISWIVHILYRNFMWRRKCIRKAFLAIWIFIFIHIFRFVLNLSILNKIY